MISEIRGKLDRKGTNHLNGLRRDARYYKLVELMRAGKPIPPIDITSYYLGVGEDAVPRYDLRDGGHRILASEELGYSHIPVRLVIDNRIAPSEEGAAEAGAANAAAPGPGAGPVAAVAPEPAEAGAESPNWRARPPAPAPAEAGAESLNWRVRAPAPEPAGADSRDWRVRPPG